MAASSYLNSAPLIWSFARGGQKDVVKLTDAVPSRCADLLAQSLVDVALVPVIEYQRISDVHLVPDVCVGSSEAVRSVVLATRVPDLRDIRSVALDESSRTSSLLVKVIFREFIKSEPQWIPAQPDLQRMLVENDAALIIGDPGMTFARDGLRVFDMASLWREHTGLGFVFAMWMIREQAAAATRTIDFKAACEEGLKHTQQIIDYYEPFLGLPRSELQTYLTKNITFFLDAELRAGLNLYYELAHKHGLIESVKPLQFI
ncbi:MAG: menaquinone biosynthesis protein [bacterium]